MAQARWPRQCRARGPAHLRGRGLRRGLHAGTAGQGAASAGTDGGLTALRISPSLASHARRLPGADRAEVAVELEADLVADEGRLQETGHAEVRALELTCRREA